MVIKLQNCRNSVLKKTLNRNNTILASNEFDDLNNIELLSNYEKLNTAILNFEYVTEINNTTSLSETRFFNMYEIVPETTNNEYVSAITDAQNNIILKGFGRSVNYVDVDLTLKPINYVGDIYPLSFKVKVTTHMKADKIETKKNGKIISTSEIDIFDYYKDGTSLGSLFEFEPVSTVGEPVHEKLSSMQIVIDPSIITAENVEDIPAGVGLNSLKFSFLISKLDGPLKFSYDDDYYNKMVSEPFTKNDEIYIKYVNGGGTNEPTDFGFSVETRNDSTVEYWNNFWAEPLNWQQSGKTETYLSFIRQKGVSSMEVEAGIYSGGDYSTVQFEDVENIVYLDVNNGLDKSDEPIFVSAKHGSLKDINGAEINETVHFDVEIKSLNATISNPVKIYKGSIIAGAVAFLISVAFETKAQIFISARKNDMRNTASRII